VTFFFSGSNRPDSESYNDGKIKPPFVVSRPRKAHKRAKVRSWRNAGKKRGFTKCHHPQNHCSAKLGGCLVRQAVTVALAEGVPWGSWYGSDFVCALCKSGPIPKNRNSPTSRSKKAPNPQRPITSSFALLISALLQRNVKSSLERHTDRAPPPPGWDAHSQSSPSSSLVTFLLSFSNLLGTLLTPLLDRAFLSVSFSCQQNQSPSFSVYPWVAKSRTDIQCNTTQ